MVDSLTDTGRSREQVSRARLLSATPCALAMLPFLVLAARVLVLRRDPVYSGDAALLNLATRSASLGERTLGPYSRFGFFHPGPALFYVLSPFEWITGYAAWAMPFGVQVLNAVVAGMTVLVVQRSLAPAWLRRSSPELSEESRRFRREQLLYATCATAGVLAFALEIDIGLLQIFWNPLQIILPLVLLALSVALADSSWLAAGLAIASGTFLVQTDLSTGPVVAVLLVCGIYWFAVGLWRNRATNAAPARPRRSRVAGALLVAFAVGMWVPTVVQQLQGTPGNLTKLIDFFTSADGPQPRWGLSLSAVGRELSVFPRRIPRFGNLTTATVSGRQGEVALLLFFVLCAALVVVARRREEVLPGRLGIVAAAGGLVAVVSVHSIRGPLYWYLTAWMSGLAVPLLVGWLQILSRLRPYSRGVLGLLTAALVVVAVLRASTTPINDNRAFPNEPLYRRNTIDAWQVLAPAVAHDRGRTVLLGGDPGLAPTIQGVALKLTRAGIHVRVPANWSPPFGPENVGAAGGAIGVMLTVGAPPAGYRLVGHAPSAVLGPTQVTISVKP